jgi:hypothetical protein
MDKILDIIEDIKSLTDIISVHGDGLMNEQYSKNLDNLKGDLISEIFKSIDDIDKYIEVFHISDTKDYPSGKRAFIGFKSSNGNFDFISVPFNDGK